MKNKSYIIILILSVLAIVFLLGFLLLSYYSTPREVTFQRVTLLDESETGEDLKLDENLDKEFLPKVDGQYITIGDSKEKAFEKFGEPDSIDKDIYYYGQSYLIFEKDIVAGFYKATSNFPVSIGEKISPFKKVEIGFTRRQVVNSYGTPVMYLPNVWYYSDTIVADTTVADTVVAATVVADIAVFFDEDFLVIKVEQS